MSLSPVREIAPYASVTYASHQPHRPTLSWPSSSALFFGRMAMVARTTVFSTRELCCGAPDKFHVWLSAVALLQLDHVIVVGRGPYVGQAVVDMALVANGHPGDLIVRELNVVEIGGVVGVGEADEAAGRDDKEVIDPVNMCGQGRAGGER